MYIKFTTIIYVRTLYKFKHLAIIRLVATAKYYIHIITAN